jgi:hypothetical protein
MTDPVGAGPNSPYDPINGDYSSYKPLAKTAWAKDGSDEHGLTFSDFLDVINPLQHLPIISHIYRAITGEKIGLAAKLAGDALYGGPIGLLSGGVTSALESGAGKTTGELIAEVARDIFGPSSPKGDGETPAATQEARLSDSERAHEDDLAAAMAQMAMAPAAPVATPQLAALAPEAGSTDSESTSVSQAVPPIAAKSATAPRYVSAAKDGDETTQRINKSIAEARRAQAGMLLASLQQADPQTRPLRSESDDARKTDTDSKPVANPYALPAPTTAAGAPAAVTNWSNETLAETIARYERAVAANRH